MPPLDCKWCLHFGPAGSTWETRSPLLLDKQLLSCRRRQVYIPTPFRTYCLDYHAETDPTPPAPGPRGPIWVRCSEEFRPRVPFPRPEYNAPGYRVTPVPNWEDYLRLVRAGKDADEFLVKEAERYLALP